MIVVVDGTSLRAPLTGIGRYVQNLTSAVLPHLAPDETLIVFDHRGFRPLDQPLLDRLSQAESPAERAQPRSWGARSLAELKRHRAARVAVRTIRALRFRRPNITYDLFHAVNYLPPAETTKPVLPVVHDLSHLRFPQFHPAERLKWLEALPQRLAETQWVQAVSRFTQSELTTLFGISAERVCITYPGISACFQPRETTYDAPALQHLALSPYRYFLVVATQEPRKNFPTVADAYLRLPSSLRDRYPLVWAGPTGWGDLSLSEAVQSARASGHIRLLGFVSDERLAALYRNTALFMMPSRYEGFGMPIAEALACGAPVAVSRIPVFREVARESARYVDALDVDAWSAAMLEASETPHGSRPDRAACAELDRFSWDASAKITLGLYRRLTGGSPG